MKDYWEIIIILFMDNWYKSPALAALLHTRKNYVEPSTKKKEMYAEMTEELEELNLFLKKTMVHGYGMEMNEKENKVAPLLS